MLLEQELAEFLPEKDTLLTIGVFDGVHLGHQYLLARLMECARQQDWLGGVLTFRQHPQGVLAPATRLPHLTSLPRKVSLLKDESVDAVIALSFTTDLARLGAREFVALLKKHLKMRGLVVGPDFVLGRNREGNVAMLGALGQEMDFSLAVVSPLTVNGVVVSSTAIRAALADGDMKKVVSLIGRPFSLEGRVTTGVGRGTELGFPTANLEVDADQALPADGIYATWAHIADKVYPSVTNIGWSPTFGGRQRTIETYITNFCGNLYGRELKIDIVERLRGEERFDSIEALKKQIAADVARGTAVLGSRG